MFMWRWSQKMWGGDRAWRDSALGSQGSAGEQRAFLGHKFLMSRSVNVYENACECVGACVCVVCA